VGGILQELVSRVESEPDREVCGFVLGGTAHRPPEIVAMRNAAADPARAFRMDPGEVLGVLRRVEREECGIAALYHSHPSGGPALSARDVADLTAEAGPLLPGVELWVIGLEQGKAIELRAYRWREGGYSEVARRRGPFTF
jgi:proteasome lid subunit RPN8/RPN11